MSIELLQHLVLEYPSGSAVAYHKDSFFLIGDDSNKLLELDTSLRITKEHVLFNDNRIRIPKNEKPDFESSTIYNEQLYILSSGSKLPQRVSLFIIDFNKVNSITRYNLASFFKHLDSLSFCKEINIEALTTIKNNFLFFNRANNQQENTILVIPDFAIYCVTKIREDTLPIKIISIELPKYKNHVLGISGADYDEQTDILLLTCSAENTDNAYDDGEIIGSVIVVIQQANQMLYQQHITVTSYIELEKHSKLLHHQKIESIAIIHQANNSFTCMLAADNDIGNTELFKIKFSY